jgi:hypothetical protein
MRQLQKVLIKFGCGAFGSFLLLAIRGIPPLPGIGPEASQLWIGVGWQVGDDQPIRSFIFGLTWPPLIAALTR